MYVVYTHVIYTHTFTHIKIYTHTTTHTSIDVRVDVCACVCRSDYLSLCLSHIRLSVCMPSIVHTMERERFL